MPQSSGLQPSNGHSAITEEWSVTDCIRILLRRKATLLWITGIGALGALLITSRQPHVYQSRAALEVQSFNENFLALRDVYPTATTSFDVALYVQTQVELLQQDSLIQEAARKLRLGERPEFQPPAALVSKLRQHIRIVSLRNSRIVQIVSDARDAQLAADLANTLARTFIEQSIETRQRAARQTYESLRAQLDELRRELTQPAKGATTKPGTSGERGAGTSEADANRRFYEAMLEKANDARMASVVSPANIRLIAPAEPATRPYKPNLMLNLALGILGGFVLAISWVLLQEQNTPALHAPGEAGTYLALPELGAIPNDGVRMGSGLGFFSSPNGKLPVERAVLEQASSCLSESFRSTLASILGARNSDSPRVLVITSSRPMEGKTTMVSNLGIALAEIGGKVLLIDGDMRRPQLHRIFDQSNGWGLSDLLREGSVTNELPRDVAVNKTAVPHLYLLPSGSSRDNIFGLLYSGHMSRILSRFREEFDYVLVDAPPCLEFADARNMARYADGLVLVVRANYTGRRTAQAAVQRLDCDGIRVTGVVLNRWDRSRGNLYGYPAGRAQGYLVSPLEWIGNRAHDLSRRI
jgi:receptor protein-tyrosine kinase